MSAPDLWLHAIDEYARRNDLDPWAARIVAGIINFGSGFARQLTKPSICTWSPCHNAPRPRSLYCSHDCSNNYARWRYLHRQRGCETLSHPIRCYQRLVDTGLLDQNGDLVWIDGTEPWESDPLLWLHDLMRVSNGDPVPVGLPRLGQGPPQLRLIAGGTV